MANNTEDETISQYWEECVLKIVMYYFFFGILGSVSVVFGILGNVASLIVLVQPSMRSSTSILLVALAVYDTLILTTCLLRCANILNLVHAGPRFISSFVWKFLEYVDEFVLSGTIYTTVVVTIERAVVVVLPLKAKLVCTKTRASVACVVVFVWSLIYSVPHVIVYYQFKDYNKNRTGQYQDFENGYFYRDVFMLYLNTVFHLILPVGVIIILNIAIIQRLCTRGRQIIHQVTSRGDNQTQLTVMIIVLTGIFCASRIMYMVIIYLDYQPESEHVCPLQIIIIRCIAIYIVILSSATNFIVYSIFGHKFRRCLQELCCSRHCLQAHRSPPETQAPSGNKLSTSASSLHPNILQYQQRSNSPFRTSALLAVPETGWRSVNSVPIQDFTVTGSP